MSSNFICRAPTPPEVREQREREKELLELDRDIRTIFAYNLPLKATEQDLFNFFATAGKIVDVKIIMDRNTRRSKGFAYIEYAQRVRSLDCLTKYGKHPSNPFLVDCPELDHVSHIFVAVCLCMGTRKLSWPDNDHVVYIVL